MQRKLAPVDRVIRVPAVAVVRRKLWNTRRIFFRSLLDRLIGENVGDLPVGAVGRGLKKSLIRDCAGRLLLPEDLCCAFGLLGMHVHHLPAAFV